MGAWKGDTDIYIFSLLKARTEMGDEGGMEVATERVIRAIETVWKIGYILLQPNNLYDLIANHLHDLNLTRAGLVFFKGWSSNSPYGKVGVIHPEIHQQIEENNNFISLDDEYLTSLSLTWSLTWSAKLVLPTRLFLRW